MGEVSSALACHWADIWIRENLDMIDNDILAPNGLARKDSPQSVDYGLFFPFGSRGYALYYPKGAETELYIDDREIKVNFELDAAVEESIIDEEGLKAFHAEALSLQENLPEELEEGKCLCQMCHH